MGNPANFPTGNAVCQTIQLIEPDFNLPTTTMPPPGNDPSLVEVGNVPLEMGQGILTIPFVTPKAGDYRFEYLYVDALGITLPGIINLVPVSQTLFGFTVDLSGVPVEEGYILRWRVVVVVISGVIPVIDSPQSFRVPIPSLAPEDLPVPPLPPEIITLEIFFTSPRSNTNYGFSELRVENLVDTLLVNQSIIGIQVVEKGIMSFKIIFRPVPPTANYYLIGRTP